jgi:A/G-specific adenine glycosylase
VGTRGERGAVDSGVDLAAVRAAVLDWAAERPRPVAVRSRRDPYAVLVAECMAHQTQIERVGAAWASFLDAFPSVEALAAARPADVLRAWGDLGYNRRAIALLRAARAIVAEHGGIVPADPEVLIRLPGVGPYTARAVAAIAYGRPVGPVDTNVRRVLGRLLDPAGRPAPRTIQAVADALAAGSPDPGAWTYALMDLGATVCRSEPHCSACPLARFCAHAAGRRSGVARRSRGDRGPSSRPDAGRLPAGSGRRPGGVGRPARPPDGIAGGRGASLGRARPGRQPFPATRRWLRGRIMERLRAAPDEAWVSIEGPIGLHGPEAVEAALVALEREGLLERHHGDPLRARLPLA